MPIYALVLLLLWNIIELGVEEGIIKHEANANSQSGVGKLNGLKIWWQNLMEEGLMIKYFPEPSN